MASASSEVSGPMESHIISASNPFSFVVLQQIANASALDEISNFSGSVRHHIYHHGLRDRATNTMGKSMLFFIYQTTRHGPQNGFRLCLVHRGYHIASPTKSEYDAEDDIDRLEKAIPQGHMEVVVLGEVPPDVILDEACEEASSDEASGGTNSDEASDGTISDEAPAGTISDEASDGTSSDERLPYTF